MTPLPLLMRTSYLDAPLLLVDNSVPKGELARPPYCGLDLSVALLLLFFASLKMDEAAEFLHEGRMFLPTHFSTILAQLPF